MVSLSIEAGSGWATTSWLNSTSFRHYMQVPLGAILVFMQHTIESSIFSHGLGWSKPLLLMFKVVRCVNRLKLSMSNCLDFFNHCQSWQGLEYCQHGLHWGFAQISEMGHNLSGGGQIYEVCKFFTLVSSICCSLGSSVILQPDLQVAWTLGEDHFWSRQDLHKPIVGGVIHSYWYSTVDEFLFPSRDWWADWTHQSVFGGLFALCGAFLSSGVE